MVRKKVSSGVQVVLTTNMVATWVVSDTNKVLGEVLVFLQQCSCAATAHKSVGFLVHQPPAMVWHVRAAACCLVAAYCREACACPALIPLKLSG
jgi:hypothetical protein